MRSLEEIRARITVEAEEFRLYRASTQTRQLAALYDALIDGLLNDLATVAPDKLGFKQGALAQLTALRQALVIDTEHINLIV